MDTELSLARHVALVTGASSGIGRATALALGRAGAKVAVNHLPADADAEAAAAVAAAIAEAGGETMTVAADVSDEAAVAAMLAAVVARFGTVHVLVNNAGIQRDSALVDMSLADWRRVLDVNLTGQFLCARAAAREFLRRGVDPGGVDRGRQDRLHELGARDDPLGRPRQLRRVEGRGAHADALAGAGAGAGRGCG